LTARLLPRIRGASPGPRIGALAGAFVAAAFAPAFGAASGSALDFRPVAVEGSARAAWVDPAGIGSSGDQSLVMEGSWREDADGTFDLKHLATLTLAAATNRRAYAYIRQLEDQPGTPAWTLIAANRVVRPNGSALGTAVEWRGGTGRSVDGTVAVSAPLGARTGLRASLVLEDLFASDIDGQPGSRRWRGGVAYRVLRGDVYLSWDYDRLERTGEVRQWYGVGRDRGGGLLVRAATNDRGDWSLRVGIGVGTTRPSGALAVPDTGPRRAGAALELVGEPIVH
jgi:hypothetical protein